MGALRLILAMAVVIGHSERLFGYRPVAADRAVQAFYVISGFYMALVLDSKYTPDWKGTKIFLENRYLRLAPTYWVILVLSVGEIAVTSSRRGIFNNGLVHLSGWSLGLVSFSNVFIFAQDWLMFLGFNPDAGEHSLHFAPTLTATSFPAHHMLAVPPAWTLGVELTFYLTAPWLARRRTATLVAFACGSLIVRGILFRFGFREDPWTYRFFPSELLWFLVGMLSFRSYKRISFDKIHKTIQLLVASLPIVFALGVEIIPSSFRWLGYASLYIALPVALPFLFNFTRTSRFDAKIGELSYPTYLGHYLLLPFAARTGKLAGFAACIGAVCFAYALAILLERPIERWRQARIRSQMQGSPGARVAATP